MSKMASFCALTCAYSAPPVGLEPTTVCLEGSCSDPLSYGGRNSVLELASCLNRPSEGTRVHRSDKR